MASISSSWLLERCANLPSASIIGGPLQLALRIHDVCSRYAFEETELQTRLFDIVGMDAEAFEFLTTIVQNAEEVKSRISRAKLEQASQDLLSGSPQVHKSGPPDLESLPKWQVEDILKQDALAALNTAALAQVELDAANSAMSNNKGVVTHLVSRTSHKQLYKDLKTAQRRAKAAVDRARKAGVILEDHLPSDRRQDELLKEEIENFSKPKGLDGMSALEIQNMLATQLAPEGTKQYYANAFNSKGSIQGLPSGTSHEYLEGYEKVSIPAKVMDQSKRRSRIQIADVMCSEEQIAFSGTSSLNPMQSEVFEAAFYTQENLLICAPTGAGKTNVAMLTVINHFREKGIIGTKKQDHFCKDGLTAGRKVIYIAPMKALAQEVVEKFDSKLKSLNIDVKELTGDMQLTKAEAERADIIVTTPEKWDVVTRKGGDGSLAHACGLLIIDEVHLLADDRGAVIESVVARLHRTVEVTQKQVRLVGLSATLPNYKDVAEFLRVNASRGLFYFGPEHRPVPLTQTFIGITGPAAKNRNEKERKMNQLCYDIVSDALRKGYQVMVFVHSRKGTGQTAMALAELAEKNGELDELFLSAGGDADSRSHYVERAAKSNNREVSNHFLKGMGIHHAGMLRSDRKLSEQMFADGAIKVLCCTATLAWGINLPAHTVVIKGTEIYNPEKGGNEDLSILDVMQIFGRAGRPQFDKFGEAFLITTQDAFLRYLDKLVREVPIESNFIKQLPDHLNAEIVAGTVANIQEAAEWLTYTYMYVRMVRNPLVYGINMDQKYADPSLSNKCVELVSDAAKWLDELRMITFSSETGNVAQTDMGRVASYYYIQTESVATFNEMLGRKPFLDEADIICLVCSAKEFENVKVRQDEMEEVDKLKKGCIIDIRAPVEEFSGKCAVLLQAYISRVKVTGFTLISDTNYIAQNAGRIARGLFEMCLRRQEIDSALKLLRLSKSLDKRVWWNQTPLRQFEGEIQAYILNILESSRVGEFYPDTVLESTLSLLDMQEKELARLCDNAIGGQKIKNLVQMLPRIKLSVSILPITSSVVKFKVVLEPHFKWSGRWHGGAVGFWVWVEDEHISTVYHHEFIIFSRKSHPQPITLEMNIPVFPPKPEYYFLRVISDTWVGCESLLQVPLADVLLPHNENPYTDLLDLTPLPVSALQDHTYEQIYRSRFERFNPIQTQLFHVIYHTDLPVLLGAPTGGGKTVVAELALLRLKRSQPQSLCVYIAPLKALARERLDEWKRRFGSPPLSWKILEVTGDTRGEHDMQAIKHADVLICTPEKWDLISRGCRKLKDVNSKKKDNAHISMLDVGLLILDEVHLLGEERGSVLEAIVCRSKLAVRQLEFNRGGIASSEYRGARIIGLSTALANPRDLASWMGIDVDFHGTSSSKGIYNFRPSVRPVPLTVRFKGFAARHYVPRMASMNKPAYAAIKEYSPTKPVLIFVSSRRQTRLTALDLISFAAGDESPSLFLGCAHAYIDGMAQTVVDDALRHTLTYGIGLHHAGLHRDDRVLVETLFLQGYIQVLVATSTLAWGVNLPAHLVIIKGTEYYDGFKYVDYPITDVLQMMGRAGRPQFDHDATACIFVSEEKKAFYKKFLYEPFPVESCFAGKMAENLNAEISSGAIESVSDAVTYMSLTYYARRIKMNPSFYGADSTNEENIGNFLLVKVKNTLETLEDKGCVHIDKRTEDWTVTETFLGRAASTFYLDHRTPFHIHESLRQMSTTKVDLVNFDRKVEFIHQIYLIISFAHEFSWLSVRQNENETNSMLATVLYNRLGKKAFMLPFADSNLSANKTRNMMDSIWMNNPNLKCYLLLQAFVNREKLPNHDYVNDTRTLVDQVPRFLSSMVYIAQNHTPSNGWFEILTAIIEAQQIFNTRCPLDSDPLLQIPYFSKIILTELQAKSITFPQLCAMTGDDICLLLSETSLGRSKTAINRAIDFIEVLPSIIVKSIHSSCHSQGALDWAGVCKIELSVAASISPNNYITSSSRRHKLFIVLGLESDRRLLVSKSMIIDEIAVIGQPKIVQIDLSWKTSNLGVDDCLIARFIREDIKGLDLEATTALRLT